METPQKQEHSKLKGYWIETLPNGEKLYCYRWRTNGKKTAVKLSMKEFERRLSESSSIK